MSSCGVPHPSRPGVKCISSVPLHKHDAHYAHDPPGSRGEYIEWENPHWEPPSKPLTKAEKRELQVGLRRLAQMTRPIQRSGQTSDGERHNAGPSPLINEGLPTSIVPQGPRPEILTELLSQYARVSPGGLTDEHMIHIVGRSNPGHSPSALAEARRNLESQGFVWCQGRSLSRYGKLAMVFALTPATAGLLDVHCPSGKDGVRWNLADILKLSAE